MSPPQRQLPLQSPLGVRGPGGEIRMKEPLYTPWEAVGAYLNRALNPIGPLTQIPPDLPGGLQGFLRMIPGLGLLTGSTQAYQTAAERRKQITHPLPKWTGPGWRDVLQAVGNVARPLSMGGVGGETMGVVNNLLQGAQGFAGVPEMFSTSWGGMFSGLGGQAARGLMDRTGVLRSMSQEPTWNAPQAMRWGEDRPMAPSDQAPSPEAYGIPSSDFGGPAEVWADRRRGENIQAP